MEHGHPLSRLAAYVAVARARGRPTRLVLRNTERFGLIHLYFGQGRLVHVEGHQGTPLNSLSDLATWQNGVIRQDDVPPALAHDEVDPRLEVALSDVIKQLEERGIVQPAPPARVWPSAYPAARASVPPASMGSIPPVTSAAGLPPLAAAEATYERPAPQPQAAAQDRLTDPQWQLLALVIHQVLQKAGELIGAQMAEGLLRQALTHAARSKPVLNGLELEPTGWLKAMSQHPMTQYAAYDVAEAVATLLTSFEMRCAALIGKERAQQMVASAAAPFRASLVQIGLAVGD